MTNGNTVKDRLGKASETARSAAGRAGRAAKSGTRRTAAAAKSGAQRTTKAAKEAAASEAAQKAKAGAKKAGSATVKAGDKMREGAIEAAKEAAEAERERQDEIERHEGGRYADPAQRPTDQGVDFLDLDMGEGLAVEGFGFGDDRPDPDVRETFFNDESREPVDDVMFGTGGREAEVTEDEMEWLKW